MLENENQVVEENDIQYKLFNADTVLWAKLVYFNGSVLIFSAANSLDRGIAIELISYSDKSVIMPDMKAYAEVMRSKAKEKIVGRVYEIECEIKGIKVGR